VHRASAFSDDKMVTDRPGPAGSMGRHGARGQLGRPRARRAGASCSEALLSPRSRAARIPSERVQI